MRSTVLGALLCWAGCATAPIEVPNFALKFGVSKAPTIVLISPSWSDRGLAMLEQIRKAKTKYQQLQVVMVVMDDLPVKSWNMVVKALNIPGVARRSQGLGLETEPFGPIREVPMVYWLSEDQRIIQRAVGFIEEAIFNEQTRRLMEGSSWSG